MRLLIVAPLLPAARTLQAGERLVFELIKQLSEKHEIHLEVRIYEGRQKDMGSIETLC